MIRRARLLVLLGFIASGGVGLISSTQSWLIVTFSDAAQQNLAVPGASAVPLLAPLSLTVLAIGAALSIAGRVLRVVLTVLGVLVGFALTLLTGAVAATVPISAIGAEVAAVTGISGEEAVAALVSTIGLTAWPWLTVAVFVLLTAIGILGALTSPRWGDSGRRYRTDSTPRRGRGEGPVDAIESWDDLSRGEDPTSRALD